MTSGRRALGWAIALVCFLATGPIMLYTYLVATSQWQGADKTAYPSLVLLPILMVFPYILWCGYFFVRGVRGQALLVEHFLIVLLFTPILSLLTSALVAGALDNMGGFAKDDPLWWLSLPVLYLWQIIQYVVVQLVHKNRVAGAVPA